MADSGEKGVGCASVMRQARKVAAACWRGAWGRRAFLEKVEGAWPGVGEGMGGRISPLLPCLEFVLLYSPLLFFLPVFFLSMNPVCLPVIVAPYLFWLAAIAASCFTASVSTVVTATGLALSLLLLAAVASSYAAAQRKLLTPVTVLTAVVTCEYTRTIYNA